MGEIERWFLEEFGVYGFVLTPPIYDPFDFTPYRLVLDPQGKVSRIKINTFFGDEFVGEIKVVISTEMRRYYHHLLDRVPFTPIKKLPKFNL